METNFNLLMNRYIRNLIEAGYCPDCAAIIISPYTIGNICNNCQKLIEKENKKNER